MNDLLFLWLHLTIESRELLILWDTQKDLVAWARGQPYRRLILSLADGLASPPSMYLQASIYRQ